MNMEKKLGIKIDVEPNNNALGKNINHTIHETGNSLDILFEWMSRLCPLIVKRTIAQ